MDRLIPWERLAERIEPFYRQKTVRFSDVRFLHRTERQSYLRIPTPPWRRVVRRPHKVGGIPGYSSNGSGTYSVAMVGLFNSPGNPTRGVPW